jgi:hypothetical protein
MAKQVNLSKILTTVSVAALIGANVTNAAGAPVTTVNNPSSFNTPGDWDVARILANQDSITLGGNHAITADLGIYIEDIVVGANTLNSLNIDAIGVQIGNITLGGGVAGQVVISAGNDLTLVGGDRTYREAGANAVAADYSGISGVNFSGAGSLTIDTGATVDHHVSGNVAGVGDAITLAGALTNGANGTLNVNTDLSFSDNSWLGISVIDIGAGTVTIDSTNATATLTSSVSFTDANSGSLLFTGANNLTASGAIAADAADQGTIEVAVGVPNLTLTNKVGDDDNGYSLGLLDVKGDTKITFNNSSTAVHINKVNFDADGTLSFAKANREYKIDAIENLDKQGKIYISENTVFRSNGEDINFGTENARLNNLQFRGAQNVKFQDGVNLYVDTIINTKGTGNFYFYGTSIFDINSVSIYIVGDVSVESGGNLTFVAPSSYATMSFFAVQDNATLIFNSDLQIDGIGAWVDNKGTLKFDNQANMSLEDTAGNGIYSLGIVEFAGKDVILEAEINGIGEFQFTSSTPMTATFTKIPDVTNSIGGSVFTNTSVVTHTVVLSDALTSFSKDLATSTDSQLNFQLDNGINAAITGGDATGTNFTTGTNGKGELELKNSGVTINSVGANSLALSKLTFTNNATITDDTYATNITVADTITATFGGDVTGTIEAANAGNGTLAFTGDSTVTGTVGATNSLAVINITGDTNSVVTFIGDVAATTMSIGAGQVTFDSSAAARTINAETKFTSDFGGKILVTGANNTTFVGNMALTSGDRGIVEIDASVGANTVEFQGQIGDNATDNALNLLDVKGDSVVKFTTNTNVHINSVNLDADGIVYLAKSGGEYKFEEFSNTDGNGTLQLSQNATLKSTDSTVNLGTSGNRLKSLTFSASKTLTVEDGVNIYVDTITNTVNQGGVIAKGVNILSAANGLANAMDYVDVSDDAALTLDIPSFSLGNNMSLGDNSTLILTGNLTVNDLVANNDNNGTVRFSNPASVTLTAARVGATGGSLLDVIEFAGSDVQFNAQVVHTNGTFSFTSATPMIATFTGITNSLGDSVFTNTSGTAHTVVLSDALTSFSQDLATSTSSQLNFQLDDGVNAAITGGDATGSNFTTGTDGKGELELSNSGMTINRVGTSSVSLGKVIFSENASVTGGVYASEISIADAKEVNLKGVVKADKYNFEGLSSQVNFADGVTVSSAIKGDVPGGIANFAGNVSLNYDIGSSSAALSQVEFVNNTSKKTTLAADIYATDVVTNKGAVALSSDVKITGDTTTNSTSFDLASYSMENDGNVTMSGTNTVKFNMTDTGAGTTINGGNIASSGLLKFNSGTKLVLQPQDSNLTFVVGTSRQFFVASASSMQNVEASQIQVVKNNKSLNWTVIVDNNGISLLENWNLKTYAKSLGVENSENIEIVNQLSEAEEGSSAEKMSNLLIGLAKTAGAAKVEEAIDLITNAGEASGGASAGIMSSVVDSIVGRTLNTASVEFASSNEISGVAAGDAYNQLGAWFSPFYGSSTQGKRGDLPGYQNRLYGATIGFDARFCEDLVLGVAGSISSSDIKHKGLKLGDTTKMNSYLFSIYGLKNFSDKVFWSGSVTINRNDISNNSKRVASANGYEMASARYVADSFSTQHMVGVNNRVRAAVVTPMVGLRYKRDAAVHYKEVGTSFQNLEVKSKAQSKVDVIAGIKSAGYLACNLYGKAITSELRGFVNYTLSNNASRQKINLDGIEFISSAKKPARLKYNFGLGVNALGGVLEYGASYDLNLSDKLVGHQGSIKVRAEF